MIGFLTASIASIFVRKDVVEPEKEGLAEVLERLDRIERQLAEAQTSRES